MGSQRFGFSTWAAVFGLLVWCLSGVPAAAQLQRNVLTSDPRELSIDIFTNLKQGTDPEAISVRLARLIPIFRFSCPRVTDYQVYRSMNNLYDIKVKCSGQPFYGVTVAANGYVSVYGGNGMIQPFDSRQGLVLSFGAEGTVVDTSQRATSEAIGEAIEKLDQDTLGLNVTYLALMLIGIFALVGGAAIVWVRAIRRQATLSRRKPRTKLNKPLERVGISAADATDSDLKNQLQGESEIVARHIYRHPAGFYIARGSKGKRRFFKNRLTAKLYVQFNRKVGEMDSRALDALLRQWVDAPAETGT